MSKLERAHTIMPSTIYPHQFNPLLNLIRHMIQIIYYNIFKAKARKKSNKNYVLKKVELEYINEIWHKLFLIKAYFLTIHVNKLFSK